MKHEKLIKSLYNSDCQEIVEIAYKNGMVVSENISFKDNRPRLSRAFKKLVDNGVLMDYMIDGKRKGYKLWNQYNDIFNILFDK